MILYKYGMRARGFSPLCQPMDGFVERLDDTTGKYYDVLVYNRYLRAEEERNYQFDFLGMVSGFSDTKFNKVLTERRQICLDY